MDATAHQITCCIVNKTMTGDGIFAGENFGDDNNFVVSTFARTGVTGVAMRLILNDYGQRIQATQSLTQLFGNFSAHAGSTFLNGLTVTFS